MEFFSALCMLYSQVMLLWDISHEKKGLFLHLKLMATFLLVICTTFLAYMILGLASVFHVEVYSFCSSISQASASSKLSR